jgi:methylglyoxal/glyoxal reductase
MKMLQSLVTLNNGVQIPKIGLGTYQLSGPRCTASVTAALEFGYRHIDTAIYYENHSIIASCIAAYPRESLFLTSKIPPNKQGYDSTIEATLTSLTQLNTSYLDLMLIHWPGVGKLKPNDQAQVAIRHDSWRALEDLQAQGKIRAIGVSNFLPLHLEKLLAVCRVVPAVNQFEYHPWCHDDSLVRLCHERGIAVEAYSSLARAEPSLWGQTKFEEVCNRIGKTKGQVLLRWGLQKGCIVLPKSAKVERVRSNAELDFEISEQDMRELDELHCNRRTCWDPNTITV